MLTKRSEYQVRVPAGLREDAAARQAALDEAAVEWEGILRQHYNRLREPKDAHRPAIKDNLTTDAAEQALAALRPGELDAVETLVERLAVHPRLGIPVPGGTDPEVDDCTDPASDSGDRISIVYRYHPGMSVIFVTWVIAGL
ncbi:hypothetical protein ACFV6F_35810 [Kitasatospora phosalacinea]|uniref:hypothetical protein n=1 Tax=Kitasatospora phosalacinea TaxID=2065 RepID=UPI0036645F42